MHDIISKKCSCRQANQKKTAHYSRGYRRQQLFLSGGGCVCLWQSVPACTTAGSGSAVYIVYNGRRVSKTDDVLTYRRRVDEISKDGTWVSQEAISAAANYPQRPICEFIASDTALPLTYSLSALVTTAAGDSILIAFHEPYHYLTVLRMKPHRAFTSSTAKKSTYLN